MADAVNWVFEAARYELVIKALTLLLLVGAVAALWELIRYLRTLRRDRDLARRVTLQQVYGSANDPRYADWGAYAAPRVSMTRRLARGTVQAIGVLSIVTLAAAAVAAPFLGTWLEAQDYPERADYIVPVPGDGLRLAKAAELYKQGFAPRVLLSSEAAAATDAQFDALEKAGVPRASIVSLGSTPGAIADTAEALRAFADGKRVKVIVVASSVQALRTKVIFEDTVPRVRVLVVSPPDGEIERPWWNSEESALRTIAEAARLAQYWIGSSFRAVQTELVTLSPNAKPAEPIAPAKPAENLGAGERRP